LLTGAQCGTRWTNRKQKRKEKNCNACRIEFVTKCHRLATDGLLPELGAFRLELVAQGVPRWACELAGRLHFFLDISQPLAAVRSFVTVGREIDVHIAWLLVSGGLAAHLLLETLDFLPKLIHLVGSFASFSTPRVLACALAGLTLRDRGLQRQDVAPEARPLVTLTKAAEQSTARVDPGVACFLVLAVLA
jgi:hypothetical protein